jgi:ERCC4-related helicase
MGISEVDTAQMDGSTEAYKRKKTWASKRVFFCTPQTLQHDLQNSCIDNEKIVLVVFDEAHRATGNYAYVEIMKLLNSKNTIFRVLALSATPGNDLKKAQQVITNLQISNLEMRCEDDHELKDYTHTKDIEYFMCEEGIASVEGLIRKELSNIMRDISNKLPPNIFNKNTENLSKMLIEEGLNDLDRLYSNKEFNSDNYHIYRSIIQQLLIIDEFKKDAGNPEMISKLESFQKRITTLEPNLKAIIQNPKFNKIVALAKKSRHDNSSLKLRQPKVAKLKEILEVYFDKSKREVSYITLS